jgi:hypothetical protein
MQLRHFYHTTAANEQQQSLLYVLRKQLRSVAALRLACLCPTRAHRIQRNSQRRLAQTFMDISSLFCNLRELWGCTLYLGFKQPLVCRQILCLMPKLLAETKPVSWLALAWDRPPVATVTFTDLQVCTAAALARAADYAVTCLTVLKSSKQLRIEQVTRCFACRMPDTQATSVWLTPGRVACCLTRVACAGPFFT